MEILNLNGTPYENGKKSGEFFLERLNLNLKEIEEKLYTDDSIKKAVEFQFNKLKILFLNTMKKLLVKLMD